MSQPLRIVTYNIAHGRGLAPIQGFSSKRQVRRNLLKISCLLANLKPDIVALQEIDENSRWAGNFDHLELLRRAGRFKYAVFGVHNRREGLFNLNYGNAILSRHPILEWETTAFGSSKVGEKGFLFVEIDIGGRRVPVVNLHLHYRSRRHRLDQVDKVFDYLEARQKTTGPGWAMPPVVCGDFNAADSPQDATASLLSQLNHFGGYALHPLDGKRTFPSPLPSRSLDFVLVPEKQQVTKSEVVRSYLSDHRPVMVEMAVPNAA
ncbi:endonuclease [Opitutaceae bacterium TAV4]|uniref:endonuclease/exonuclease/phosphatase family protein n=1 Tax=Geminisphaera colitermitum TaxID=1148786 RepID=UPI0001964E6A|nr:endonuclease/exonuclease/phosphatase family protein [Geminisphaera colitermitum]RRJ95851.1 endonuclease [Opitutaceae bacterium TAV4]RRK00001.1 endonuclease [Opitutaceae bacterium TAV3]